MIIIIINANVMQGSFLPFEIPLFLTTLLEFVVRPSKKWEKEEGVWIFPGMADCWQLEVSN